MKKQTIKNIFYLYAPPVLWACLIFYLSSISSVKVSEFFFWDYISKKAAHVFVYAVLFTLIYRANKNLIYSFILTFLYAVSDEFHQSFVQGRTATPLDLGFDISGANIAAYSIWKLKQFHQRTPKKQDKN